jgi:hypothetical protein
MASRRYVPAYAFDDSLPNILVGVEAIGADLSVAQGHASGPLGQLLQALSDTGRSLHISSIDAGLSECMLAASTAPELSHYLAELLSDEAGPVRYPDDTTMPHGRAPVCDQSRMQLFPVLLQQPSSARRDVVPLLGISAAIDPMAWPSKRACVWLHIGGTGIRVYRVTIEAHRNI